MNSVEGAEDGVLIGVLIVYLRFGAPGVDEEWLKRGNGIARQLVVETRVGRIGSPGDTLH